MLMVQALVAFLRSLEGDHTFAPADQELVLKVSICLFQACIRTLHEQGSDGSWGHSADDTAFAILTLAETRQLWIFKGTILYMKRIFIFSRLRRAFLTSRQTSNLNCRALLTMELLTWIYVVYAHYRAPGHRKPSTLSNLSRKPTF